MRQVNLKVLRGRLTEELKNLPFEITKNGKVVGVVVEKGLTFSKEFVELHSKTAISKEKAIEKLSEIIVEKKRFKPSKATIPTEKTPGLGCSKEWQCRRKGK